ncbi:hypothetical protein AAFF_G00295270 [Aldrovandia affinis]|uniref:Ig-like domain-containing protein n=1 Tax=Aldrovandia affinis TaxID=143900 RepID=A0AAD7R9H1_9TELE|nr:hypothetical protein AAFF_G00295270 [Aldrovandia affinis]
MWSGVCELIQSLLEQRSPQSLNQDRAARVRAAVSRALVGSQCLAGTMACGQGVAGLLMLSSLLRGCGGAGCPPGCLCASDILSCAGRGLERLPPLLPPSTSTLDLSHNLLERLEPGGLPRAPRLEVLLLSHNRLSALGPGAFRNASGLRHLDLSCNALRALDQRSLQGLPALEQLLLFSNRLVRVESLTLAGLASLRRAYLSHNRLTSFPFFSLRPHSHPLLTTLDLSSNRLLRLPLQDIAVLPAGLQSGLFLHNNTLACACGVYGLLRRWEGRGYGSNCSVPAAGGAGGAGAGLRVRLGDPVLLPCLTSLRGRHLSYLWVSPQQERVVPPGDGSTLRLLPNGSLWIGSARARDSGVFLCVAQDPSRLQNETWEVNVTVSAWGSEAEPFNTGFTTLLGCGVSLLLVLMYLYLTPCRCCCRRPARQDPAHQDPAHQDPAHQDPAHQDPAPPGHRLGNSKHVAFLEPVMEMQNGRLRAPLPMGPPKLPQIGEDPKPMGSDPTSVP